MLTAHCFASATHEQTDPMATKFYETITDIETYRRATPTRFRLSLATSGSRSSTICSPSAKSSGSEA
jgi:hypothetical protein